MILKMILERISELNPKALKADGFDDAILGISTRIGDDNLIAYDYDKCIEILQEEMSYEEAVEYMEFNVVGSYVGEGTPIFIKRLQ
jgi:hypothetical protein|tara:strand:+ start:369 stop:626 length:258 start_codon:yes stop_codon:yes gene_type:complete